MTNSINNKGDYRVREGSPALTLGFKNFPMDRFRVHKPELRRIARTPDLTPPTTPNPMSSKGKRAAKDAKRTAEWLQATVALASGEALSAFGLALDKTGCQILERPADSPLAKAGLKVNDLLLRIDGQPRRDLADLKKPRKLAGKTMEVKYVRNQQREKAHVR